MADDFELKHLYRTDKNPSELFAILRKRRGLNLGGLKAVAAQAFRLLDEYKAEGDKKGQLQALKIALLACQEKRDILRDRKNKYKKPKDGEKKAPSLIEARERMAARNREK